MVAVHNLQDFKTRGRPGFQLTYKANLGTIKTVHADPPDMLNYERCELLISASDGIEEEWEWSSRQNVKVMMIQLLVLIW